jgi:hypothetical protein
MNTNRAETKAEVVGYREMGVHFRTINVLDKQKKTKKTQITLAFLPKDANPDRRIFDVAFSIRSKKDQHDRLEGQKWSGQRLFNGTTFEVEVPKGSRVLESVREILVETIHAKKMGDYRYIKAEHLV